MFEHPETRHGAMIESRVLVASLATLVAIAVMTGRPPALAHDEPLIQPGAAVWTARSGLGQFGPCTMNFVFRDASDIYIGAGAKCTQVVGKRVTMANREFGTVVYTVYSDSGAASVEPPTIDDFALIRIDRSEWHRVSPVVLDAGTSPEGMTTSEESEDGAPVFMTGQGTGGAWPARHRIGVLLGDDPQSFRMAMPSLLGDGGAPVLYTDFNALGVASGHASTHGAYGTKIERVLQLLHEAGFEVELVTGIDHDL